MFNLQILRTNKFGDHCYDQSGQNNSFIPNIKDYWTILNPSDDLIEYYKNTGCVIRTYNKKKYLMSPKASSVISSSANMYGSAGVIYFIAPDGNKYYILTVDNKTYLQNTQGSANYKETPENCVIREIYEELKIIVDKSQLKLGGYWTWKTNDQLVNYKFYGKTVLFYIQVNYEQIAHLIPNNMILNLSGFNVIPSYLIDCELDETLYVIIISEKYLEEHPENIDLIKNDKLISHSFNGHHREAIMRHQGKTKFNTDHLTNFVIY
jgi:hypothetical protein